MRIGPGPDAESRAQRLHHLRQPELISFSYAKIPVWLQRYWVRAADSSRLPSAPLFMQDVVRHPGLTKNPQSRQSPAH